jgi:hypothetical protein
MNILQLIGLVLLQIGAFFLLGPSVLILFGLGWFVLVSSVFWLPTGLTLVFLGIYMYEKNKRA